MTELEELEKKDVNLKEEKNDGGKWSNNNDDRPTPVATQYLIKKHSTEPSVVTFKTLCLKLLILTIMSSFPEIPNQNIAKPIDNDIKLLEVDAEIFICTNTHKIVIFILIHTFFLKLDACPSPYHTLEEFSLIYHN